MDKVLSFWNANPLLRDFVEGLVSAAVGGAVAAVLGLNLGAADAKTVLNYALIGAISAAIAYLRHRLEATQTPALPSPTP